MNLNSRTLFIFLAFLLFSSTAFAAENQERVFFNAKVFTADPAHPYAEAVAIRGDKIVAVGSRAQVSKTVASDAEMIDLKGRFLMPGLIDSHVHAVSGGQALISAYVGETITTIPQLAKFAAEAKKTGRGMRGDILYVSGIPLAFWSKNKELNQAFNSGAFADQPVLLRGMDGHTAWANKVMLKRANINKQLISSLNTVERGYYGFSPDLEPNGFVADKGMDKLFELLPKPTPERMLAAARAAVEHLHSLGITAWLDPSTSDDILAAYRTLAEKGELNSHVRALPVIDFAAGNAEQQLAKALATREQFKNVPDVRVVGIKVFADGVLEYPSHTAHLSKPYNSGKNGELLFPPADFAGIATAADKQGLIVHVHAIGDQAVTEALNGIAAARKANGNSSVLHSITHLQLIRPDDIPRFRELGVIASFQLYWANAGPDAIDLVQPHIDPLLFKWQYPARSLLDDGGMIAGASDWPVSTANVFHAIYQAETRKGPKGVLDANQRVPREAMLYAYTRNAARAIGEEARIGSIAPGKQADMVMLDRDVLTVSAEEARDTKALWAMVGGKTVYRTKP